MQETWREVQTPTVSPYCAPSPATDGSRMELRPFCPATRNQIARTGKTLEHHPGTSDKVAQNHATWSIRLANQFYKGLSLSSDRDTAPQAAATHLQTMAASLPGALFRYTLGPDGREQIAHMSPGCAVLWEVDNLTIEQSADSLWRLVDARDLTPMRASIQASASSLTDWSYQWRITTPSGIHKWLHGVARPQRQDDGGTVWDTFIIDITHSRRTEASLRDTDARYRQMLDRVSNVSVQGYGTDLITRYWNKASERLYGYTAEEAIGRSLLDLIIPPAMVEGVKAATAQMIATGEAIPEGDLVLRRKDGTPIEVFSSHAYLDIPGHEPEFYCIDFDLTERREADALRTVLESQLRESQKMEALGTLAGGVAHDFNNIVTAILGNVELALSDIDRDSPARTSLLEIRKASRRARDLVKQILAFSRRQVLERKDMRLHRIVEESTRLLRISLPAGTDLRVACEADTPVVLADATQIEQVLLNLCTNASQAIPKGRAGLITVTLDTHRGLPPQATPTTLAHLGLGEERVDRWARLTVSDNGEGMDPETRARIFEPFFTTKSPGAGTGLGLAVVHGILREHQALLDLHTAPGQGTSFALYFPASAADQTDPASAPAPMVSEFGALEHMAEDEDPEPQQGPHILYLDDDELITFLMKRLLEKKHYRVSVFTDASEALSAFCHDPAQFDLVISDYNMPGMSGLDFARAVKARSPLTPLAITSGHLHDSLRAEAPAAGVNELIYKPDTVEDLFAAVDRLATAVVRN